MIEDEDVEDVFPDFMVPPAHAVEPQRVLKKTGLITVSRMTLGFSSESRKHEGVCELGEGSDWKKQTLSNAVPTSLPGHAIMPSAHGAQFLAVSGNKA